MRLWLLALLLFAGCMVSNQSLQEEIEILKQDQVALREKLAESEQKSSKMEIALENGLQTVIGNKRNIALIYNIIKQITTIMIEERSAQAEQLKRIRKIAEQMEEEGKEPKAPDAP